MTQLGIILALLCALATNVGFLCKHRGAAVAPAVTFRHPLRSAAALFAARWFAIGFAVAAAGWVLHVAAMSVAPLSLVQTVISGGLVLLAYPAEHWFGLKIGKRERTGLLLSAMGLVLLAVTAAGTSQDPNSSYSVGAMISFEAGLIGVGLLMLFHGSSHAHLPSRAALLGASTGLLLGVSDVALKALTGDLGGGVLELVNPWAGVAILTSIVAFFSLAKGLQTGEAIPVITLTSVAANCSAILGGVLVFGDPLGSGTVEIVARAGAFALVIAAAALMPAPLRAAGART